MPCYAPVYQIMYSDMKLYATTRSERAEKGQGGNKFLDIDVQAGEERAHVLRLTIEYDNEAKGKHGARIAFVSGDSTAILYNLRAKVNEAINAMTAGQGPNESEAGKGKKKTSDTCGWGGFNDLLKCNKPVYKYMRCTEHHTG